MGINLVEKVVAQLRVTLFLWFPLICRICSAWFNLLLEIPYYALGNHHSFEEEEEGTNSLLHLKWNSKIYWTLNWLHVSTDDSSSSSSSSEVHWLDLPDHIVSSHIANRLSRLKDFIQFGAVCRTWRCIYINSQNSRSPKVPFLMVATELNSDDQTRGLYSLIDKRVICNSQIQIPHKMHCPGSSHGWVFIVCPKTLQIRMLNPFLPSDKNQIHLPPITAFEHNDNYAAGLLRKAILSADPVLEPTNFTILAIESGRLDSVMSFYKPGDKAWTSIDSQFDMITDVIYYRDKFVVVNHTGYVFSIDLNHPKPKVLTVAIRPPRKRADKRYLVELSGDLLHILRYYADEEDANSSYPTIGFDVFKLDQCNRKWILLDNLGGHILFLGDNSTYCVSASDVPECEPNSIYFTDGYATLYTDRDEVDGVGPPDMGVYHFEDCTIKPFYPMESKMIYPVPILIQPPSYT